MLGAEDAKAWGLVNHIFPAADLLTETRKIVAKILTKAPVAVAKSIACINDAARGDVQGFEKEVSRFGDCFETDDVREGTGAFLEKRKPAFTGK
jgi:enoyl-CoA hydratase